MVLQDITDWIRSACAELAPGEMIKPSSLQLLDAMNAVEVGHEKTDTGLTKGLQAPLTPFDPFSPITAEELCWIIDRLVQLEISWHQATPICQNVYTSLYYHNFQLLFQPRTQASTTELVSQLALEDSTTPPGLITTVLKSYILSYRKTLDLVFVELAKGNVIDGEDCWLDDYGLGITMQDEIEEVLELGAVAQRWLSSEDCPVSDPWREGLLERITFRNCLLNSIARLVEPPGWPRITTFGTAELKASFERLSDMPCAPEPSVSSAARAAFDERIYTSLRQHMPLPTLQTPDGRQTTSEMRRLVDGLELAEVLGRTEDYVAWELAIHGKLWSGTPMLAFTRSLLITTLSPTRDTLFRQHSLSIDYLADVWLAEQCGMEPGGMRQLGEALQTTGAEILALPSFRRWRDILTGNLVDSLTMSLYNRPRHRRNLLASALTWAELADDARAYARATAGFPSTIAIALEAKRIDGLLEAALLGWELDLIDRSEERQAWYWIWTLSAYRVEYGRALGKEGWRVGLAKTLTPLAMGMMRLLTVRPVYTGPAVSESLARRAFTLRHKRAIKKPLQPPGAVTYPERLYPEYDDWVAKRRDLDETSKSNHIELAEDDFVIALDALQQLAGSAERTPDVSDWRLIVNALESDIALNLSTVGRSDGWSWDWDERVHRLGGPRWVLRVRDDE